MDDHTVGPPTSGDPAGRRADRGASNGWAYGTLRRAVVTASAFHESHDCFGIDFGDVNES